MLKLASHNGLDRLSSPVNSNRSAVAIRWGLLTCGAVLMALAVKSIIAASFAACVENGSKPVAARLASFQSPGLRGSLSTFELPAQITSQSTRMRFALIPAGECVIGSPHSEADRREDEGPQHAIRILKPFYLGVYEVSQTEYQTIMAQNPSEFSHSVSVGETSVVQHAGSMPVENVTWFDAVEFCNRLSERDGRPVYYRLTNVSRDNGSIAFADVAVLGGIGYRLPSEVEWEHACRAGTTSPFEFGDVLNGCQANVDGGSPYGTDETGPSLRRTTSVGSYSRNSFGLFDMHGNVAEWCEDVYDANAYSKSAGRTFGSDSKSEETEYRVARGGSWSSGCDKARAAHRFMYYAGNPESTVGIRVACSAPNVPSERLTVASLTN